METDAIRALADSVGFPKISLYFPTHVKGPDVQQDPIRLKNALGVAADKLREAGQSRIVDELLAEARKRTEPQDFWLHQGKGLAVFIDEAATRWQKLPEPVDELVVVAERFHLRPLIRMFGFRSHGYLLAVTRNTVRFYEVRRHAMTPIEVPDMPAAFEEIRAEAENDENPGSPANFRASDAGGRRNPEGRSPEEHEEIQFGHFLHGIARAVDKYRVHHPGPLVLAADPRTFGHLRPLLRQNGVLEDGLQVNPGSQPEAALHESAWPLLSEQLDGGRRDALGRLRAQIGTGDGPPRTDVATLARAAVEGRLEAVFYQPGAHRWGRYDEASHQVTFSDGAGPGDEDLIDFIAVRAMQMGGVAYPLREGEADLAPVAGLLRF